ncbi:MAG: PAS domain S-box protein [Deltaproteobacteria bacterium]|nr:PAS domain S-box protein [Deltaproteobacteria bacterium]
MTTRKKKPVVKPESDATKAEETVTEAPAKPSFPIVGIGASAGGLAAFEAFFSGFPSVNELGMAFVLVQHLAPGHNSILTNLIQRYTSMHVLEVTDGVVVEPNHVYIIPPNRDMALLNGALQLLEPTELRGHRLPIDFFFRSLAQDQQERSICVILSGTGSDGSLGLREIKAEGGTALVQTPETAEYDGMPRSAIASSLVDYILPADEMPAKLISCAERPPVKQARSATMPVPKPESQLKKIFVLLRAQTGHDFSQYKISTIDRRIERRMSAHQIETLDQYVKYLQKYPVEVEALFNDLLIGVTNFFRDPEAFKVLEEKAIPNLFADKEPGTPVRVWSIGCSTGEEAYSIAILLQERMETLKQSHSLQVFATDIDRQAIATARAGIYPASIAADISADRLARFFTFEPDSNTYRINKNIRDMMIFSEQDIIKDPPFSKVDLISCRNLLIYMDSDLQKKIIPLFHYALNPGGTLFLGTSETEGEFGFLFAALDRKAKLFKRKDDVNGAQRAVLAQFIQTPFNTEAASLQPGLKTVPRPRMPLRELTEQTLLQQVGQAAALVNSKGDILYLHGRSGMYLEPAPGEAGINNVLKMAREGLRRGLATSLRKAVATKEVVRCPNLNVKTNGHYTRVNLTIRSTVDDAGRTVEPSLYLVVLEEAVLSEQPGHEHVATDSDRQIRSDAHIEKLEQELRDKENDLLSANQGLEASNEELKSANEELQSVNEELQSTNEELVTSQEELQSTNEELFTVNNELQINVADLSRSNNDMNNLLAGTGVGTIFVDHNLNIVRFTPQVTAIINLIQSDIGRPVGLFVSSLVGYDKMSEDITSVLDTLVAKEIIAQSKDGKWYTMRILPYRTLSNVIEGAVITFVDITEIRNAHVDIAELKRVQAELLKSEARLRLALELSGMGTWDFNLLDLSAERSLRHDQIFGYNELLPEWSYQQFIEHVLPEDCEMVECAFHDALEKKNDWNFECRIRRVDGVVRWVSATGRIECDAAGVATRMSGVVQDISERKEVEEARRTMHDLSRLAAVVKDAIDAVILQHVDGRIRAWNPVATRMYGWSEAEALQRNIHELIPEGELEKYDLQMQQLLHKNELKAYRTQRIAKDGRLVEIWLTATALVNESGQVYAIATTERASEEK